jgi:acetyl esterase/lipase
VANLRRICEQYGGDPNSVLLVGFSRGAIACSYLGLRDETMADVWLAFLPHSHIDGGRFTPNGAREGLARTRGRATFVSYGSSDDGRNESPKGAAVLRALGFPVVEREIAGLEHTDLWFERDSPIRREMREWIARVLQTRPGTHAVRGRVVDAEGKGVARVRVQCGSWHWAVTGEDGTFVIPSLVDGRRRLTAAKEGLTFTPSEQEIGVAGEDATARLFTAAPAGR